MFLIFIWLVTQASLLWLTTVLISTRMYANPKDPFDIGLNVPVFPIAVYAIHSNMVVFRFLVASCVHLET